MWFTVKIQLISPISLFKTSPFIGISLFHLEFSFLKICGLSYLGQKRVYI